MTLSSLDSCLWPLSRLHEGVELLCRSLGTSHVAVVPAAVPAAGAEDPQLLGRSLDRIAAAFDLECEAATITYAEAAHLPGPLVVGVQLANTTDSVSGYLIVRALGAHATVLTTSGSWVRVRRTVLTRTLRARAIASEATGIDAVLDRLIADGRRRRRASEALTDSLLSERQVADAWLVRPDPGSHFATQLRRARVPHDLAVLLTLHAVQLGLWVLAWMLVGRSALEGRAWGGWLAAWGLLLLTTVPIQARSAWLQGSIALRVGRLLKERLLTGALRLSPDEIRHDGAGRHLGRVIESDAIETLALSGGLQAALAGVELVVAAAVLSAGVAPVLHVGLLLILTPIVVAAAAAYHGSRRQWTLWRLAMTHHLVEGLTGHRTRLAQEVSDHWHLEEDHALEEYAVRSHRLDRYAPLLQTVTPRLWMVVSIAALAPAFVAGASSSVVAVSVGGLLLAGAALRRFADGLSQLSGATAAWAEAQPLFAAASRRPLTPAVSEATGPRTQSALRTLDVRDVSYRYPTRPQPALVGCTLAAGDGDRLLLQGPSGGGKSTLAAIIAGLRSPDAGLVLVDGLDRRTLGDHAWRRRTVAVPQFHENHVFAETFAFNLLMGRRWPPTDSDIAAAEEIAVEMGLGALLSRMPAGLLQVVGESGWQLSQGERSRLFMARALLQGGEVMILDESFAALDPGTLRDCLQCVLKRAPTLIVVAHP